MKGILSFVLVAAFLLAVGCTAAGPAAQGQSEYASYREIPGVTQADIDALEALRAERPTLVYGFIETSEAFLLPDGTVGGFASLLCQRMNQLMGFEFELQHHTWEALYEGTLAGEIDLVGDLTATPERQALFYMTDAMIQRVIKIFTNRRAPSLETLAKQRPVRCAFLAGGSTHQRISQSWELPFEPVLIEDETQVPHMLQSGLIDAFIEEGILEANYDAYEDIQAEEYYPLSYSSVSLSTGNPQLEPIITIMQKYLKNGGASELVSLYSQGYGDYLKNKLSGLLTQEEAAYISRHNTPDTAVLMACESDNYPSSFYNATLGMYQGVAQDVLRQIAELTGLHFKAGNAPYDSWPSLLEGLESGRYAVVSELQRTPQREARFLWTEEPYYSDYYAMLSRIEYPEVDLNQLLYARVGLMEDTAYADVFRDWFPDSMNVTTYARSETAIEALDKGEIDLLMANQSFLLNITNHLEMPGFKINLAFNYTSGSYLGFNKDEAILCSIVNKAQRLVNTDGITEIWKRTAFDYERAMLANMVPYFVAFTMLLLTAVLIVSLLLLKNRRISKSLEQEVARRTDELALQTATLTTIFDSIPDLVFCKDADYRFTRCNKSFEDYFGWREQDIIGQEDSAGLGMTEEEIHNFRTADRTVMEERRVLVVEEYIPAANGAPRMFETIKTPLIQNGNVVGIMGISRDITLRKTAQETLKLILDNLDACIYITDIETGNILFINDSMLKEYGDIDCLGKPCWTVLQSGFTQRCDFCPVPKLLESGDPSCVWEEHSTVTGKYYRNTDSIIQWHDGTRVHMQHAVDITDLIRLQKDLESASKAKSDFLSRMSHEIRTPLNAIIGMVNIAMGSTDNKKTLDCLTKADSASKHLLSLINDILDMSKIEADKYELDHREFSFEKMLMNVANVTNFRAEEKRQNFIVNLNENVPDTIIGDDLRLSQVVTNLLTNAVKFTPEGGTVKLSVTATEDTGDSVQLTFVVEDTGIGISEEQQSKLFTSFEQADGSISRRFGGTGLGLAISKRIVELMDGRIWIESQLGQGSRFIFTIRAHKGSGLARAQLSGKIRRESVRILAVDDSPEVRDYFLHIMASLNLPCDVASDGFEALERVAACGDNPYNIFFIDWQMPNMDGIELTRKLRDITGDNAVVFMISVADWGTIEKEAVAAGVRSFISKPLFPSTLVNVINTCIEVQSGAAPQMATAASPARRRFGGHRILIAEDVEINREIMSAVLEETGLMIDYAENGLEAVAMFRKHPLQYSLIFMDIHMPEMDGYEATRTIRGLRFAWAADIPIVAMTANVFREDVESCLAAGMNDHLGKPLDPDILFDKLNQYLD